MDANTLLLRQLRRLGLSPEQPPALEAWKALLGRISRSYTEADQERARLDHAMTAMAVEMQGLLDELCLSTETRLAAERNKLRSILSSLGAGLILTDAQLVMDDANRVAERLLGFSAQELRGRNLMTLIQTASTIPTGTEAVKEALIADSEGLLCDDDVSVGCKDGSQLPVSCVLSPVLEHDALVGTVLIFLDMTERRRVERALRESQQALEARVDARTAELAAANLILKSEVMDRKRAEAELRKNEARFRSLVVNGSDVIIILDKQRQVGYASPSMERVLGYGREALATLSPCDLIHPDERPRLLQLFETILLKPGNHAPVAFRLRHADQSWRYVEGTPTNLLGDPGIQGVVVNLRDITERKVLEHQLTQRAFWDPLTGLANRALLMERLNLALSQSRELNTHLGLLFIDLDNFKYINDSLGHAAGDALLTQVAERLLPLVRQGDTVARLGGDEFTILLENIQSEAEAEDVARRILERLQVPVWLNSWEVVVSASVGLTITGPDSTVSSLLREADLAMYAAKGRGKSCCEVFRKRMHDEAHKRVELEAGLRRAIRDGELRLYYQPIVDLRDGRMVEVEVLVRWQHPEKGFLPPSEFIPLAEQSGLIVPMGHQVMLNACRQLREWQERFPERPLPCVAINLSPRQFAQKDLVQMVAGILQETGLDPSFVKLEITESVAMDDAMGAILTMKQLEALGVSLAMDDFGTGYSSFNYLKRFPVNTLKIDRSFVDGIGKDAEDTTIVNAIVALAKALDLDLTAEGIENMTQARELCQMGCGLGQGYLFARPMPAAELERLLASGWRATVPATSLALAEAEPAGRGPCVEGAVEASAPRTGPTVCSRVRAA